MHHSGLINRGIDGDIEALQKSRISGQFDKLNVIDLISCKKIIQGVKELPINIPVVLRILFYIIIPLLTWVAVSLVDKIVVALLDA